MARIEVENDRGEVVWRSPDIESPIVEQILGEIRVVDMDTSQVVASYRLAPGERIARTSQQEKDDAIVN